MATDDKKFNAILGIGSLFLVIFVGISAYLLTLPSEVKATQKQVQKITDDYLPYFAFEYIVESNQRLIDVLITLPYTTKDDPRYKEAIEKWNKLQNDVVKQVGQSKRGSEQSQIGGE